MKSGVILVSELVTKRQGLFDMQTESYNIYIKGSKIHSNLTQDEFFDIMEDLSVEFYQTGSPSPEDLYTEIITE